MQANLCCEARMAVGNSRMMCRRISSANHHRDPSQSAQFQSLLFQWLPEMSSHSQKPKEFSRKPIFHFVGMSLDWITTNRNVILIERLISVARTRLSFRFDRIKRLLASSLFGWKCVRWWHWRPSARFSINQMKWGIINTGLRWLWIERKRWAHDRKSF